MFSVLASSAVDRGFDPGRVKLNTIKLVFAASPLSTQHSGVRAKTGWLGNHNDVFQSEAACISVDFVSVS